jgi:hypothetical protein
VHEATAAVAPDARVIYADYDPVVVAHGRALLAGGSDRAWIIGADLRSPEQILGHPTVRAVVDFEPVALVLTGILHFLTETDDPYAAVSQLTAPLAPGSHLVVSHVTGDHHPAEARVVRDVYDQATAPFTFHTRAQILRFFDGFDLVEPGLVPSRLWRPAPSDGQVEGKPTDFAGVGRKRHATSAAGTEDK